MEHTYIIIAGTTKAGTASLFRYLGDHPQVCPSNIKETRFFFDQREYELVAARHLSQGMENYGLFFTGCPSKLFRLEATPDYLYSPATPDWIRANLPRVHIIFILRNPVDRLVSWYRFGKQQGLIGSRVAFEDYVRQQLNQVKRNGDHQKRQIMCILEQGRYSRYLEKYLDTFSRSSLHVVRFETMVKDAPMVVTQLATDLGIDPGFYADYQFDVYHRTRTLRFPSVNRLYVNVRRAVRTRSHRYPAVKRSLALMRRAFDAAYFRLISLEDETVIIPDALLDELRQIYSGEEARLSEMLGIEWGGW